MPSGEITQDNLKGKFTICLALDCLQAMDCKLYTAIKPSTMLDELVAVLVRAIERGEGDQERGKCTAYHITLVSAT